MIFKDFNLNDCSNVSSHQHDGVIPKLYTKRGSYVPCKTTDTTLSWCIRSLIGTTCCVFEVEGLTPYWRMVLETPLAKGSAKRLDLQIERNALWIRQQVYSNIFGGMKVEN